VSVTRPVAVLIGMPGAGKSSVGRALAKRVGVRFRDSDDLVVEATGRSVTELFAESEQTFRAAETAAILDALDAFEGVLALGGGSLLSATVRQSLGESGAPVVLLRTGLTTLAQRVGSGAGRPLLAADPVGRLTVLAEERGALYDAAADLTVDTDGRTVSEVVELVHQATIGVRS
jgi:shikimate kinase